MERFKLEHNKTSLCDLETIGGRIKHERLKQGLLQKDLVDMTGLNSSTIRDCENNTVPQSIETIDLICNVLNLETSYVYDDYLKFISGDVPAMIKAIREDLELNKSQFAKLVGTDAGRKWESGKMKPSRASYEVLKKYIKNEMSRRN